MANSAWADHERGKSPSAQHIVGSALGRKGLRTEARLPRDKARASRLGVRDATGCRASVLSTPAIMHGVTQTGNEASRRGAHRRTLLCHTRPVRPPKDMHAGELDPFTRDIHALGCLMASVRKKVGTRPRIRTSLPGGHSQRRIGRRRGNG
jgi:hypothetical protein